MTFILQSYEINPKNEWNCFGNHVFYNTLSFPKAYVIKFFLFLCSESSNIANNKGKFWRNGK